MQFIKIILIAMALELLACFGVISKQDENNKADVEINSHEQMTISSDAQAVITADTVSVSSVYPVNELER